MVIENGNTSQEFLLPSFAEIPGVGLFLEQVSKYINEYMLPLKEPGLTGSMISNYVKKGIIANPVKKQYNREQIAYLIFIAIAKTVLSLEDITTMIGLQTQYCDVETAYEYFRSRFMEILEAVFESKSIDGTSGESEIITLSQNMMITAAHKIYLDLTFDGIRARKLSENL